MAIEVRKIKLRATRMETRKKLENGVLKWIIFFYHLFFNLRNVFLAY